MTACVRVYARSLLFRITYVFTLSSQSVRFLSYSFLQILQKPRSGLISPPFSHPRVALPFLDHSPISSSKLTSSAITTRTLSSASISALHPRSAGTAPYHATFPLQPRKSIAYTERPSDLWGHGGGGEKRRHFLDRRAGASLVEGKCPKW